jgi:hypothetical protein
MMQFQVRNVHTIIYKFRDTKSIGQEGVELKFQVLNEEKIDETGATIEHSLQKFLTCPEEQKRIISLRFQLSSFLCSCKKLQYTNVNISCRCKECVHNYRSHFQNLL